MVRPPLQGISYLCIRVVALIVFLLGLHNLMSFFQISLPTYLQVINVNWSSFEIFLMAGLPACMLIIISIVLWLAAGKLSIVLLPKDAARQDSTIESIAHLRGIEAFVLGIIGLMLVIFSFTTLVRIISNHIVMVSHSDFGLINYQAHFSSYMEQGLRLVIGIALLVKADSATYLLHKIRRIGLKKRAIK